ncbi:Zinc finger CCCH domain-containing protein 3 [Mycena sanguinolenta]|uniref:Zinc finger CCCH domain-containing protein 3 n=1 Tax=Mycena sanguinolenta TaxID=230812 RepID=A0A8H6Z4B9_9AGAR|nr:Zinc finger CCCH domain-containing protein 3 [Mycena sanguinolenta]
MTTDAAQLKSEIARLTASISQHKSKTASNPRHPYPPTASTSWPPRSSTYINPNYKPPSNKYIRATPAARPPVSRPPSTNANSSTSTSQVKEVVLNGVAFESSTRSLSRNPPAKLSLPPTPAPVPIPQRHLAPRIKHFAPPPRQYKPKSSRGRGRLRGRGGNMTLTNSRRPYTSSRAPKRPKSDKPCPRFSTTGTCTRGLTCPYTHDPATTAICWPFLSGTCPLPAAQCALSHDPTPERTPLCTHFLAGGTGCTRPSCPFPHVNVGPRTGVCRAFAVLGFCAQGLECPHSHVRECPDFAESGTCTRKGCKLPHVIRAAGARKLPSKESGKTTAISEKEKGKDKIDGKKEEKKVPEADAEMGDEFISLTFNESSEEDEESDDESEGSESSEEEDDEGGGGGGDDDDDDDSEMEGGN